MLIAAVTLLYHVHYLPYAEDDAYIHMRIAANLLFHGAPYYNLENPAMTSTAPLWIALTAPLALLGQYQALGVAVLNAAITTTATLVWTALWTRVVRSLAPHASSRALCVLGIIIWATLLPSSLSLMETPFAMLLVGAGFLNLVKRGRWGLTMLGISIFVRPECVLYAVSGSIYVFWTHREISKSDIGSALGAILILALSQLYFFGTLTPHTAIVKSLVYQLTLSEFVKLVAFATFGSALAITLLPALLCCLVLLLVFYILRPRNKNSSNPMGVNSRSDSRTGVHLDLVLTTVMPAVLILAAYAIRRVAVFPWYTPLFLLPLYGAAFTLFFTSRFVDRAIGVLVLLPLGIFTTLVITGIGNPAISPFFASSSRVRTYLELGKQLRATYGDVTLCAPEIGGLGYTFSGPILDAIGLASPEAMIFHPLRVPDQRSAGFLGAVPSALVKTKHPDLIVGLDIFMEDVLRSDVSDGYERLALAPLLTDDDNRATGSRPFGASKLIVLTKKGLPAFQPHPPLHTLKN